MGKKLTLIQASVILLFFSSNVALAEKRFGRDVIKLADPKAYQYFTLDDMRYPVLSGVNFSVSALAYRGTRYHYVEVGITNRSDQPVAVPLDFITMSKPGYTILRSDIASITDNLSESVRTARFEPAPAPYNPTIRTDVYGNTAVTSVDNSSAVLGAAVANALAAADFNKQLSNAEKFLAFLNAFGFTSAFVLQPKETRLIVSAFEQLKPKKAPFTVTIKLSEESFTFRFKE